MNNMKIFYCIKVCLISLLLIGSYSSAKATHLAAADMHVDYVPTKGPYTYKITLNIYKACEGGARLGDAATLQWESISGCLPGNFGPMTRLSIDTLDKLCDTFKQYSSCRPDTGYTNYPAFIKHTWVLEVVLPGGCTDWVFSWREGARNTFIKNIII